MAPKILDLDAIQSPAAFTIKLKGKEHEIRETSIGDFIETTRIVEQHAMKQGVVDDLELTITLIRRTVPTIPEEDLRSLTFTQLQAIQDFVQTANGEKAEKTDEAPVGEPSEGNAPKAN
jgi:hypothetical protein